MKLLLNIFIIFGFVPGILAQSSNRMINPAFQSLKFIKNIELRPNSLNNSITSKALISKDKLLNNEEDFLKQFDADLETRTVIESCEGIQFKYAQLLDTAVESIVDLELYHFIDEWMDTRYRFGGHSKNGIDCSGFSNELMKTVYHIDLPGNARNQYHSCIKVDKQNLSMGNLVFFNTRGGVSHVGVYLMNGYFVHSSSSQGVMISNLSEPYYERRFISGGIPESAYDN